jgi:hypothetical protein
LDLDVQRWVCAERHGLAQKAERPLELAGELKILCGIDESTSAGLSVWRQVGSALERGAGFGWRSALACCSGS